MKNNNKVRMSMFRWIIGAIIMLVVSLSGWVATAIDRVDTKATQNTASISEVSGDIKSIRTDLGWLKKALTDKDSEVYKRINHVTGK